MLSHGGQPLSRCLGVVTRGLRVSRGWEARGTGLGRCKGQSCVSRGSRGHYTGTEFSRTEQDAHRPTSAEQHAPLRVTGRWGEALRSSWQRWEGFGFFLPYARKFWFFSFLLGKKGSIENFFVFVCSSRSHDDIAVVVAIVAAVAVRAETVVAPARPHFRVGDVRVDVIT